MNQPLYWVCICLFIQININRNSWNRPPVFIYLCKSLVVTHTFRFNIQSIYLFTYSKRCQEINMEPNTLFYLLISIDLLLEIYSYTTVIVMCPKQEQNANLSQVEIENLIVRGRNLPRTNSTNSENQNIFSNNSKTSTPLHKIWR